jgi:hypothetical protein
MAHYLVSHGMAPSESVVNSESGSSLERSLVFASAQTSAAGKLHTTILFMLTYLIPDYVCT